MKTEKLYYQDPYLRSFTGKILRSDKDENGRFFVVLDKTAFYPTGGGQPHDIGTLNGIEVYDVEEVEGEIRHYIDDSNEEKIEYVGEINWNRRSDHMQQHAGQHILSASFEDTYGYKTVSFHLGKEVCSIDLEVGELTTEEVNKVEEIANAIVLENHSIETKWVDEEELANYTLRKELSVPSNIRLVIIPDFDYNGCGGTHPNSTGQVSSIKILHWEKQRKNIRVHFVCGKRVVKQLHDKQRVIQGLTTLLSAPQENLEKETNRILQHAKALEKTIDELKLELIDHEANLLLDQADLHYDQKIIKSIYKGRSILELQQLAKVIASKKSDILVLFINENETKLQFVCARGKDLNVNMNNLVKHALPLVNGKGGGNDTFAQGGGDKIVSTEQLMEELLDYQRNQG